MRSIRKILLFASALCVMHGASAVTYDLVIRNGQVYDGSGKPPYRGSVAINGDRIAYIGKSQNLAGRRVIDARGIAIAPGFINMLAHPEETLFTDGRALSDLAQGVTLEVMGESSMGPVNANLKSSMLAAQGDFRYDVNWTTLGGYLDTVAARGIGPNIASLVGAGTVRAFVLGMDNIQPDPGQQAQMRALVRQAMEEGALGLTTALIYTPDTFAGKAELLDLASEAARCGGIYSAHMRSEGDRIEAALQETIDIARGSGGRAEIYHLKLAGRENWRKLPAVIDTIEKARREGVRIGADIYTYTAGATGFDAAMPSWVQEGGYGAWVARLKDPAQRARVIKEMRDPHPANWENLYAGAGPEGTLLLQFKNPALKQHTGKSLAQFARERGVSPEDAAIDLVIEDGTRVGVAYYLMDEANVRRQVALPWVSFGSDAEGFAPEGVFLKTSTHPRAYGNFARVYAKYVRDEKVLTVQEAVRKMTALPATVLALADRGTLRKGAFADVVVFDPATIQDHSTFGDVHHLATGVQHVLVNGRLAWTEGAPTSAPTGRVVRGRAWKNASGGGCRSKASDWTWAQ